MKSAQLWLCSLDHAHAKPKDSLLTLALFPSLSFPLSLPLLSFIPFALIPFPDFFSPSTVQYRCLLLSLPASRLRGTKIHLHFSRKHCKSSCRSSALAAAAELSEVLAQHVIGHGLVKGAWEERGPFILHQASAIGPFLQDALPYRSKVAM